jgi:membrane protein DedA with SNARE-associated domain
VSSHEITQLIHDYGLIVVFLAAGLQAMGFPIPGGTALVIAGIDASTKHGLPLVGVIAAGAAGAIAGTSAGFAIGRWRGEAVLQWAGRVFRQKPERIEHLRVQFATHGLAPVFIARFFTGLRNIAGLVAGASGMAFAGFFLVSSAAAIAWAALITLEYYFAGHAILGAPTWLQILLIVLGLIATIVSFRLLQPAIAARAKAPVKAADTPD